MKKTSILLLAAVAMLYSYGLAAQSSSSGDGHRFQDSLYGSTPSFRTKEAKDISKSETAELVRQTKESAIYLLGEKKDTIMIPENFSARIQYDQKVGGTVVTVGENPYDWRWDYSQYWNSWAYSPWRPYGYYDPWYYNPWRYSYHNPWYYGYYDPWYYGGWYDPWYYGGWHAGWYDPWYHYGYYGHCGWYDPYYHHHHHHHHHHGPVHVGSGGHWHNSNNILRGHAEAGRAVASSGGRTSVRTSGGTVRGGMSVGNTVSRAGSTVRRSSGTVSRTSSNTRQTVVSRPSSATRPTAVSRPSSSASGRPSASAPAYRRPSSSQVSRPSGGSTSTPTYRRPSTATTSRPSSSGGSSYSRSSSSNSSYSRGSYSSGSSSYSRGGSSGGYRR